MSDAMLEIEGLTRRFGGLTAVDDFGATIRAGELVGLIGPNGAGKTTLFNLISGVTPPSSGTVHFLGERITGLPPFEVARRGIGRTFQNLRVFPNMTVFDNVSIGAIGKAPNRIADALFGARGELAARIASDSMAMLERVGLAGVAGELAANLSYGRRKMLEIARALAAHPKLLILDEPAAGLNDSETSELAGFITRLRDEGLTIILVEHDMSLVMRICTRVIVLASGRKIADASPAEIQADDAVIDAYLGVEHE
jgi:branched-chain amino acid transport system ATP-binding protein